MDVAAVRLLPLFQLRRAAVRIDQTGRCAVQLAGEHRLHVADKVVHAIDQAHLLEVDPVGHQLVAERGQRAAVVEHELARGHADDRLAARLADEHVDGRAEEERFAGGHLGDALGYTESETY